MNKIIKILSTIFFITNLSAADICNYTEIAAALSSIPLDMAASYHRLHDKESKKTLRLNMLVSSLSGFSKALSLYNYYIKQHNQGGQIEYSVANIALILRDFYKFGKSFSALRMMNRKERFSVDYSDDFGELESDEVENLEKFELDSLNKDFNDANEAESDESEEDDLDKELLDIIKKRQVKSYDFSKVVTVVQSFVLPLINGMAAAATACAQPGLSEYSCGCVRLIGVYAQILACLVDEYLALESGAKLRIPLAIAIIGGFCRVVYLLNEYGLGRILPDDLGKVDPVGPVGPKKDLDLPEYPGPEPEIPGAKPDMPVVDDPEISVADGGVECVVCSAVRQPWDIGCDHQFCKSCFVEAAFGQNVEHENEIQPIGCPHADCKDKPKLDPDFMNALFGHDLGTKIEEWNAWVRKKISHDTWAANNQKWQSWKQKNGFVSDEEAQRKLKEGGPKTDYVMKLQWKKCPYCGTMNQKVGGCQDKECCNLGCRRYFCFHCLGKCGISHRHDANPCGFMYAFDPLCPECGTADCPITDDPIVGRVGRANNTVFAYCLKCEKKFKYQFTDTETNY